MESVFISIFRCCAFHVLDQVKKIQYKNIEVSISELVPVLSLSAVVVVVFVVGLLESSGVLFVTSTVCCMLSDSDNTFF